MKSSNLGVVKIGLELDPVELLDFYRECWLWHDGEQRPARGK